MLKYFTKIFKRKTDNSDSKNPNDKWVQLDNETKQILLETVQITGVYETIEDIVNTIKLKKKGAYLRFGDGDIMLMNGISEMMHEANPLLAKEIREAFTINEGKLHKALAINSIQFGYDEGMNKEGMHLLTDDDALRFLASTYKFFVGIQIYSPVALHYLSVFDKTKCIETLKFLKSQNPIFVGNEEIHKELIEKLFSSEHIKTPSRNAYLEIDRIELELCEIIENYKNEFKVVVVAMGCAGRILQKRILMKNYNVYLFDFGSLLDAFNGIETRTWIKMTGIDNFDFYKLINSEINTSRDYEI